MERTQITQNKYKQEETDTHNPANRRMSKRGKTDQNRKESDRATGKVESWGGGFW